MSNHRDNATRGARQHARNLLRSSWAFAKEVAYGVDSMSAVKHGAARPSAATRAGSDTAEQSTQRAVT